MLRIWPARVWFARSTTPIEAWLCRGAFVSWVLSLRSSFKLLLKAMIACSWSVLRMISFKPQTSIVPAANLSMYGVTPLTPTVAAIAPSTAKANTSTVTRSSGTAGS